MTDLFSSEIRIHLAGLLINPIFISRNPLKEVFGIVGPSTVGKIFTSSSLFFDLLF